MAGDISQVKPWEVGGSDGTFLAITVHQDSVAVSVHESRAVEVVAVAERDRGSGHRWVLLLLLVCGRGLGGCAVCSCCCVFREVLVG